jgi:hypothetical protein
LSEIDADAKCDFQIRAKSAATPTLPSTDPRERLRQLSSIKVAYEQLSSAKPQLPPPQSPIPTILAVEATRQATADSRAAIDSAQDELESAEQQAELEEANLSDAKLLTEALEARMSRLQTTQHEKVSQPPQKAAQELVRVKVRRTKDFQVDSKRLRETLRDFITNHLGAMIAAEELGGPVVGDLTSVDDDMLVAGFSSQGKPKKPKPSTAVSDSKRQRRIDEIWGSSSGAAVSELDAACEEVNKLLDELLDAVSGKSNSGVYIELQRDSAAARVLVRSKVAQYHPKDARRLRLVDFGRELEL